MFKNKICLIAPIDLGNPYGSHTRPYSFYKYAIRMGYHVVSRFRVHPCRIEVIGNGVDLPDIENSGEFEIGRTRKLLGLKEKKVLVMVAPRNSYSNVLAIKYVYQVMDVLDKVRMI